MVTVTLQVGVSNPSLSYSVKWRGIGTRAIWPGIYLLYSHIWELYGNYRGGKKHLMVGEFTCQVESTVFKFALIKIQTWVV